MTISLQTTYREIPPSQAIESRVRGHVDHLAHLAPQILSCHVVLTASGFGPERENPHFEVHIELLMPGKTLAIDHDPTPKHEHDDLYTAIDLAFARANRQLSEQPDRRERGGLHAPK